MTDVASYPVSSAADVVYASAELRRLCARLGFTNVASAEVALAISELATNTIKYAGEGRVRARFVTETRPAYLEIEVVDDGPGIDDIDRALCDGVSQGQERIAGASGTSRAPGHTGLGAGLGAVARLMDTLEINSVLGSGTRVVVRKLMRTVERRDPATRP